MLKEYMENWKDIFGYEGLYQVSNLGRVKSLGRWKKGKGLYWQDEKILKPAKDTSGYLFVVLSKEGKRKIYLVHRLVAQTFIPNNNLFKTDINHKDECKTNNRVENLEWCTKAYNINFGTHNERMAKTLTNGKTSKPVIQYNLDGKPVALFPSVREVERRLGFSQSNITNCCNGKYKTAYRYIWRYAC